MAGIIVKSCIVSTVNKKSTILNVAHKQRLMNLKKTLKMGCMKMSAKKVYLLSGIPGSGKSYWAHNVLMPQCHTPKYISRDEVRFSIISDDDSYFAKEDEVFDVFVHRINLALLDNDVSDVIIDATHLNEKSRMKILNRIKHDNNIIIAVDFRTPLETCLDRNEKREGRAKVPRGVIRRMFYQHTSPKEDKFKYDEVFEVK